jgi:hypothetical protein
MNVNKKEFFNMAEVAQALGYLACTVRKLFDTGELKGYRFGLSDERRIYSSEVARFLSEHSSSRSTASNIAVISGNGLAQSLEPHLPAVDGFELKPLAGAMDVLNSGLELSPRVAVLDFTIGEPEAVGACRTLRRLFGLQLPIITLDATENVPDEHCHFDQIRKGTD